MGRTRRSAGVEPEEERLRDTLPEGRVTGLVRLAADHPLPLGGSAFNHLGSPFARDMETLNVEASGTHGGEAIIAPPALVARRGIGELISTSRSGRCGRPH